MHFIKRSVDKLVNKLGYNFAKVREKELIKPFNVLRLVLDDYIKRDTDFFFIQVGANNGVR